MFETSSSGSRDNSGGRYPVTVIIPVLNEEESIGKVIDEVLEAGVPRENIVVVDGGSTDRTVEIVKEKGVRVVQQEGKGKSMAIKTGLKYVKTKYTLVMDGDYTYPAKHIPELLRVAEKGYDLVIGARTPVEGSQHALYRVGNWFLTKLFNLLFGTRLRDVLSGMYIVKTEKLRELLFEMPHFSVESEIVAHIASTSGKIAEIPIEYRRRLGEKKLRVRHGIAIARDMIRLAWRYNPAFLIFALGSLLLIPGLILGSWVLYHYFFTGTKYYMKGLLAAILTTAGFFFMVQAITAVYAKRAENRVRQQIEEVKNKLNEIEKMLRAQRDGQRD